MSVVLVKDPPDSLFQLATDQWTEPFWAAARERRLVIMHCPESGAFRFPPTPFCPVSLSQNVEWVESSGNGIIYSYTIVSRAIIASMQDNIPYVPAVIQLPGVGNMKLLSNVVDCLVDDIAVGKSVVLVWHERPDGFVFHALPWRVPDRAQPYL